MQGKSNDVYQQIVDDLAQFSGDPYGFVLWAFPWGEKGSPLEAYEGPDEWQKEILEHVSAGLLTVDEAIQVAVASGHGIGKSAFVSWVTLWALSTFPDTKGVVTANTEVQLRTKTWPELAKWHRMFIAKDFFEMTATAIYSVDRAHEKTWRIDAIAWSERNTEAFAGLHNQGKRIIVIFDEASAIPDIIWETTEGALTDRNTQIMWFAFGNPTRNTGRLRECFGRFRHRWTTRQVDGRNVKITNKKQIEDWIRDYGEDSDFVRVRVRGVFPRSGSMQFIPGDLAEAAMSPERQVEATLMDPLIMAVDVARFGDDASVIRFRRGRDARTIKPIKLRGVDTMTLSAYISSLFTQYHPDAIFIDEGGVGGGVVDRCRMLHLPVIGVQFGGRADRSYNSESSAVVYLNKRAEMWGHMKDWLAGGMLDNDPELLADLTGLEFGYKLLDGRDAVQLESKADMKKRGLSSPDNADALAMTFAYPVQPSDHTKIITGSTRSSMESEYNPMAAAWNINGRQQQDKNSYAQDRNGWMPHQR